MVDVTIGRGLDGVGALDRAAGGEVIAFEHARFVAGTALVLPGGADQRREFEQRVAFLPKEILAHEQAAVHEIVVFAVGVGARVVVVAARFGGDLESAREKVVAPCGEVHHGGRVRVQGRRRRETQVFDRALGFQTNCAQVERFRDAG